MQSMIHYSCDACKRELDPAKDGRYVVRMEVYPGPEPRRAIAEDDDRDYLAELQTLLEREEHGDAEPVLPETIEMQFDLCPECRKRLLENPLGREPARQLDFSPN